jgi:hypothetical protein
VVNDIKEVYPNIGDWGNLKKHGEMLKNADIATNAAKAALLKDKKDMVRDIISAGEKFVKSLLEKGSAAFNTISSGAAHINIGYVFEEFSIRTVNSVNTLIHDAVGATFNNKEQSFINKHKKTERDMRQDANKTVNKSTKLYLNK